MAAPNTPAKPILTASQRQAVEHPLAPLLIIAGAGTGKTHTLVHRIAHLISHHSMSAERILALTFTEKAAAELQQRIIRLSGPNQAIIATTFHAFCYQLVLEFRPDYQNRRLMSAGDGLYLLREHFGELETLESELFRRKPFQAMEAMQRFFNRLRDELIQPGEFPTLLEQADADLAAQDVEDGGEVLAQLRDYTTVFGRFQDWKAQAELIDYSDMVYAFWDLLQSDEPAQALIQERFGAVFVDEFQDNNRALNLVVERLVRPHQCITAVGDEDQSIYKFRGASAYNFPDFRSRYGGHAQYAEVLLAENFRSTQPILDLANAVMAGAPDRELKNLVAVKSRPNAAVPRLLIGNPAQQVSYLATEIKALLGAGRAPEDVAVVVRTNSQAGEVVTGLANADLPVIYMHVPFFEIPAIRTARAWLAVVARSATKHQALYRILADQSGRVDSALFQAALGWDQNGDSPADDNPEIEALRARVQALQNRKGSISLPQRVREIVAASDLFRQHEHKGFYSDKLAVENLSQLLNLADRFSKQYRDAGLTRYVSYLDVMARSGTVETRLPPIQLPGGAIQVMTVHRAKGLEFPIVMIPFVQSARFPLNYRPSALVTNLPDSWLGGATGVIDQKQAHHAEERRLFYVALTRAKELLIVLSKPQGRAPFIRNLEGNLMNEETPANDSSQPASSAAELRTDLQRRLSRELGRKAYLQAHELVEAMRLVDEYEAGVGPDFSEHPLAAELRQALAPGSPAAPSGSRRQPIKLSATSMDAYEGCPLKYRYTYVDKIPGGDEQPEAAFGRIVHRALEQLHRPGGPGFEQSPADLIASAWDPAGFAYSQQQSQYRRDAEAAISTYIELWKDSPPAVLAVEHPFSMDIGQINLRGRIDRIDLDAEGNLQLVDYKTGKRRKDSEARKAPQLALYALYVQEANSIDGRAITTPIADVDLTYYYVMSPEPMLTIHFTTEELAEFRLRIEAVAQNIRAGEFPANKSFMCDYCDYKALICPAWNRDDL